MCFLLISMHVPAKNLISGMAVLDKKMERYFIEREQVCVEEPVASFMCNRCPDASRGDFSALGVEGGGYHDRFHSVLPESSESQYG